MTDKQLLEYAAKAAGIDGVYFEFELSEFSYGIAFNQTVWNPLTDDGDALRLAVKLDCYPKRSTQIELAHKEDKYAATRSVINRR